MMRDNFWTSFHLAVMEAQLEIKVDLSEYAAQDAAILGVTENEIRFYYKSDENFHVRLWKLLENFTFADALRFLMKHPEFTVIVPKQIVDAVKFYTGVV